jgi:hypothetical protein
LLIAPCGKEFSNGKKVTYQKNKENDSKVSFAFKGQKKINLKALFKNIFKKAAFFRFENSLPHGVINKTLW